MDLFSLDCLAHFFYVCICYHGDNHHIQSGLFQRNAVLKKKLSALFQRPEMCRKGTEAVMSCFFLSCFF